MNSKIFIRTYHLLVTCIVCLSGCESNDHVEDQSVEQDLSVSDQLTENPPSFSVPLVTGDSWHPVNPSLDPFTEFIADRAICDWTSFGAEYDGIEVNTGRCGYVSLTQSLLEPLSLNHQVKISAWHTPLIKGYDTGMGQILLAINGEIIWKKEVEFPSDAVSWDETFTSPIAANAGDQIILHIHNHGTNSWVLNSLQVQSMP